MASRNIHQSISLRDHLPGACRGAHEQQFALARIVSERRGAFELLARFVIATEFSEKVTAYARQQVVSLERWFRGQFINEFKSRLRAERHADRDGAIQLNDRRGRDRKSTRLN